MGRSFPTGVNECKLKLRGTSCKDILWNESFTVSPGRLLADRYMGVDMSAVDSADAVFEIWVKLRFMEDFRRNRVVG
jgi:hypothetical protein